MRVIALFSSKSFTQSRWLVALLAIVAGLALTGGSSRAAIIVTQIGADPSSGPAGSTTTVTGTGFVPSSTTSLQFMDVLGNTSVLGSAVIGMDGTFSKDVVMPTDAAPGAGTITADPPGVTTGFFVEDSEEIDDGDDGDEELCRIKVTLFSVERTDELGQTALTRIGSSVNLGIGTGESEIEVTTLQLLDAFIGDSLWPKKQFPRVLQVTSRINADGNGAGHRNVRIDCPDTKFVAVPVAIQVVGPFDLETKTRPIRTVTYDVAYKVEVTEVQ